MTWPLLVTCVVIPLGSLLEVGVRGKPVLIHGDHKSVLEVERHEHSRKPEKFRALVEATCSGAKAELFCRQQRAGWRVHGNDVARFGREDAGGQLSLCTRGAMSTLAVAVVNFLSGSFGWHLSISARSNLQSS